MSWTIAWASTSATRMRFFLGSKLGRACLRNSDAARCLAAGSGCRPEGGARRYEGIQDLGVRFALAVEAALEVIARSPLAFQIVHPEIRRVGMRRFPYSLFFKVESNRIVVIACMHGRRNPKRWKLRRSAE
jgi:hypothetical protein